ncbi:unnamed protein product [Heterobilharzia americana]|nr:unnamed protein product [Heterobilharzia americana]
MPAKLVYWKLRGLGQPIRLLLEYLGDEYEENSYGEDGWEKWQEDKFNLGLEFPNLPYFIDGDVKITQSLAIMRYIADKHNMLGNNPKERAEISMLEGAVVDISSGASKIAYDDNYEILKVDFLKKLNGMLKTFNERLSDKPYLSGNSVTHPDFMFYEALDVVSYMEPNCLDDYLI